MPIPAIPSRFDDASARDLVSAIVGVMEQAGLRPYVSDHYSDSKLGGLETYAANAQSWRVHDPDAGSPCNFILLGPKQGQAVVGVAVWGMEPPNRLYFDRETDYDRHFEIDDRAVMRMGQRIAATLHEAGLNVLGVKHCSHDGGWGSYDVGFEVLFAKS